MAKQVGPHYIIGTIDDITYYKMGNGYFMRKKTSLNKKRFDTDEAYSGLPKMRVKNFGRASQLASQVYRTLPKAVRKRTLFNQMTSLAQAWLWKATPEEEVVARLKEQFTHKPTVEEVSIPHQEQVVIKHREAAVSMLVQLSAEKTSALQAQPDVEAPLPSSLLFDYGIPVVGIPVLSDWWVSSKGVVYRLPKNGNLIPLVNRVLKPMDPGWLLAKYYSGRGGSRTGEK